MGRIPDSDAGVALAMALFVVKTYGVPKDEGAFLALFQRCFAATRNDPPPIVTEGFRLDIH